MKSLKKYYENKVCMITGAGSGIGKELAYSMADQGAHVFICGRNKEKLEIVASYNQKVSVILLDVSKSEQWIEAVSIINEKFDHIDLAIFNAGNCEYIDLPDFDSSKFSRVMDVNFMGIVYGLEACLPLLRKSKAAHISAVTSSVAPLPLPRAGAYGASKAAATYLMNSLRIDLAQSNIAVSVILPGFVSTPMTDKNDFPMPFKIPADEAAKKIIKALAKKKKEIYFPGSFTWPLRFLAILPVALQQFFTKRFI